MYEDGIEVVYELRLRGDGVVCEAGWSEHRRVSLPGWCAGDPSMAVALYLHGHRDAVEDVRVTDWQPR